MNTNTLVKRRNIHPTRSYPCRVPGYYLNFNCEGIAYLEPCFASIGKSPWAGSPSDLQLQGVIHEISHIDFRNIQKTEGGGGNPGVGYQPVEINVIKYDGEKVKAITLVQLERIQNFSALPSKRYMDIVVNGAKEFGLDSEYVKYLESIEIYQRPRSIIRIAWILVVLGPYLLIVLLPVALLHVLDRKLYSKNSPVSSSVWSTRALYACADFVYFMHQKLLRNICGEGYGTFKKIRFK